MANQDFLFKLANCSSLVSFHRLGARVGFELETQSTEGQTFDDGGGFDGDGFQDACQDWVDNNTPQDFDDMSRSARNRIRETLQEEAESHVNRDDYGSDPSFDTPLGLEIHEDGSVAGFEFVTARGGVTPTKFLKLAKKVFELDHEIDTGCSFHIHVSFAGIPNAELAELQAFATEYLCDTFKAHAPASVHRRYKSGEMMTWATPSTHSDFTEHKRAAVSIRDRTLEFRLWGNVQGYRDALTCLQLTLKSLAFAAQSKLAGGRPLVIDKYDREAEEAVKDALDGFKSLRQSFADRAKIKEAKANRTLAADLADAIEYSAEEAKARAACG